MADPNRSEWLLRLADDQRQHWQRGEPRPVEAYLQSHPELANDADGLLDLIYREVVLREERGERPALAEYCRRFPNHAAELGRLFELQSVLRQNSAPSGSMTETADGPHTAQVSRIEQARPATIDWSIPTPDTGSAGGSSGGKGSGKGSSGEHGYYPIIPGYEILGELGRGGMGVVYKARQISLKRIVALKMILAGAGVTPRHRDRFRREAEAVARMQHPSIVQIYDWGEHQGHPFFSLEFVAGGSLEKYVSGRTLPPREAAALLLPLARAMHYAHERGIVHRDLKPANILISAERGVRNVELKDHSAFRAPQSALPKITDFGLAKDLEEEAGPTRAGEIMGTPSYMAPEQAAGRIDAIGPLTDVYALGAILYNLLTGKLPFRGATMLETLNRVINDPPVPPRELGLNVPAELEALCMRCLAKGPISRPASAEALADALEHFLYPAPARPKGKGKALLLAMLVLLLIGAGIAGLLYARPDLLTAWMPTIVQPTGPDVPPVTAPIVDRRQVEETLAKAREALKAGQIGAAVTLLETCPEALRDEPWQTLWTTSQRTPQVYAGHEGEVFQAVFAPDGKQLATASEDGTLKLWDADTGAEIRTFKGHTGPVHGVAFHPEGQQLASASADGTVKLWEIESGRALKTFKVGRDPVLSLAIHPDGKQLVSGGADGIARLWNLAGGPEVRAFKGHTGPIRGLAFAPDGKQLATASEDGRVKLWDPTTGEELHSFKGHTHKVYGVAYRPDGKQLATASGVWDDKKKGYTAGEIKLWDPETGNVLHTLAGHTEEVLGLAYRPDGKQLATAGGDRAIRLWDPDTGKDRGLLNGHDEAVVGVAYRPDGGRLASASQDRTARAWYLP